MKRAGMKVWVLTGDKVGTATNISLSAGLIESSMIQHKIIASKKHEIKNKLKDIQLEMISGANDLKAPLSRADNLIFDEGNSSLQ